jgi:hypothetical protein
MSCTIAQREEANGHAWVVVTAACDLADLADPLITATVALVRKSYGEEKLLEKADTVLAVEIANGSFQIEHLLAAIRGGLPDPSTEGKKPVVLTNYRSQSAEMVAKIALSAAYEFVYPAAPQEGSTNPNQPVLGFDGWAIANGTGGSHVFVLIQVKGTEEVKCPPREAHTLAEECKRVPREPTKLSRALCLLLRCLKDADPMCPPIFRMLEALGRGELPTMHVAPVVVRGISAAHMDDLRPIRQASPEFAPATARGAVMAIGVSLNEFGRIVMEKARQAA